MRFLVAVFLVCASAQAERKSRGPKLAPITETSLKGCYSALNADGMVCTVCDATAYCVDTELRSYCTGKNCLFASAQECESWELMSGLLQCTACGNSVACTDFTLQTHCSGLCLSGIPYVSLLRPIIFSPPPLTSKK